MQPIISVVGRSESGKTTLLEGLITELKRRGHKVAVIKHSAEDGAVDTVNKDTWRFTRAGSQVSAISSGHNLGIFKRLEHDVGPQELSPLVTECDLILTEGFKRSSYPKIEVHRREQGSEMVSPPEQLLGVVTDESLEVGVPQFARDETDKIADLIEGRILAQRKEENVDLLINGVAVPLKPAFRDLLARTLMAMVSAFSDIRQVRSLGVFLRGKRV